MLICLTVYICALNCKFVCLFSWRFILHDLSFTGAGVWRGRWHMFLLGHHFCRSHVHLGVHRNPAGTISLDFTECDIKFTKLKPHFIMQAFHVKLMSSVDSGPNDKFHYFASVLFSFTP